MTLPHRNVFIIRTTDSVPKPARLHATSMFIIMPNKPTYNLLADSHKFLKESPERADKARTFTLHLMASHHTFESGRTNYPTVHVDPAPPFMSREIMQLIETMVDTVTASDVLKARERVVSLHSVRDFDGQTVGVGQLTNAFPDSGCPPYPYPWNFDKLVLANSSLKSYPYRRRYTKDYTWDDVMCVQFEQCNFDVAYEDRLQWYVSVDLKQVCIDKNTFHLHIPSRAITVKTNALEVQKKLKLSDALVREMLAFRLHGAISNSGHKITFCSDGGLGFVMDTYLKHVHGRALMSHKGIAVGDTVEVVKTFRPWEFAVGRQGVVHSIKSVGRVLFFVTLGKTHSAISNQIKEINKSKFIYKDAPGHCLACQISHVRKM